MQDLQQPTLGRYGQQSLAGMLARQHQDDVARAAEQHRVVAIALASRVDNEHGIRVARAHTFNALQARLGAVRPAFERVLRHRPVASHTSVTVACCA